MKKIAPLSLSHHMLHMASITQIGVTIVSSSSGGNQINSAISDLTESQAMSVLSCIKARMGIILTAACYISITGRSPR